MMCDFYKRQCMQSESINLNLSFVELKSSIVLEWLIYLFKEKISLNVFEEEIWRKKSQTGDDFLVRAEPLIEDWKWGNFTLGQELSDDGKEIRFAL